MNKNKKNHFQSVLKTNLSYVFYHFTFIFYYIFFYVNILVLRGEHQNIDINPLRGRQN